MTFHPASAEVVAPPRVDPSIALVIAARAGDEAAKRALYERHAPWVVGLASRMLRSKDDAADVLQDVFVVAFDRLDGLREPAAFRAWLTRITTSLVRRRRLKQRVLRAFGLGDDDGVPLDALAGAWVSSEARAELARIDRALATVSDDCRLAWLLRNVEGESLDAVAEACACSLATAKRRIGRADEVVARHLAGDVHLKGTA